MRLRNVSKLLHFNSSGGVFGGFWRSTQLGAAQASSPYVPNTELLRTQHVTFCAWVKPTKVGDYIIATMPGTWSLGVQNEHIVSQVWLEGFGAESSLCPYSEGGDAA